MQKFQFRLVILSLILMLFTLSFAQFGQGRRGQQNRQQNRQQTQQQNILDSNLSTVFEQAKASSVRIETTPAGIGSGFVISADGGIITAYHVVQNATAVTAVFEDGSRHSAQLIGFDEYQDIALLDINADNLSPLAIDYSDTPEVGETLLAIGNSRGQFNAARIGQIFALNQFLDIAMPESMVGSTLPLAPGDSGGPILNTSGEVLGVAVAASQVRNNSLGFASPLYGTSASELIAELQAGTKRGVPYMGVGLLEVTPQATEQLGYDQMLGDLRGLLVTSVVPDSGAANAGLQNPDVEQTRVQTNRNGRGNRSNRGNRGQVITQINQADIITAVDNRVVESYDDLLGYTRSLRVGDVIRLQVLRSGMTVEIPVTLGVRNHF